MSVGRLNPGAGYGVRHRLKGDRVYFTAFSVVILVLIFGAFAPSYFLREMYDRPTPPPFIVLHGAMMTGWVLLLVVQAVLASIGRISWHKKLGYAGLAYAALLVPIGCIAVTISAAREVHGHTQMMIPELNVFGISLMQMFLFGGWVGAAGLFRSRADYHKRMIVLAMLSVLPNAIVRLSFNVPAFAFLQTNLDILNAWAAFSFAVLAADAVRMRRLHPVFALGGLLTAAALCRLVRQPNDDMGSVLDTVLDLTMIEPGGHRMAVPSQMAWLYP